MPADDSINLQCPLCRGDLGISDVPKGGGAIECPQCGRRFYFEADPEDDEAESDGLVERRGGDKSAVEPPPERRRGTTIPASKPTRESQLDPASGSPNAGWSKWEFSSPSPRRANFERPVRNADEADKLPRNLIEDLAKEEKKPLKFSEFGRTSLPEEREIDAEHRRRLDVLQKGWEQLDEDKSEAPKREPKLSTRESLKFERNLMSTAERHAEPEEIEAERRNFVRTDEKLSWEEEAPSASEGAATMEEDLDGFSIERIERIQRIKSIVIGVGGLCLLIATGVGLFVVFSKIQGDTETTEIETADPSDQPAFAAVQNFTIGENYTNIVSKLRRFLEAEDVETMLESVRNRQSVEPLVREYYSKHPYRRQLLREVPMKDKIEVWEGFVVVPCTTEDGNNLHVPMEIAAGLKVDWEAVVGYSDMEWDEFKRDRPTEPTLFRVSVAPVSYYNYGFTQDKYVSVQVSDVWLDHVFYGYIPRGTPLLDEFVQLFPEAVGIAPPSELRAVLELRYPDAPAAANQIEIVSAKARGWVYRRDLRATTQSVELFANDARIEGRGANLDEEQRLVDWEDPATSVEWRVAIERPVQASIFANLANGGTLPKEVAIISGTQRIVKRVPVTDGWSAYQEYYLGELDFPSSGNFTIRLKHAKSSSAVSMGEESLMHIDRLILRADDALLGSRVRDNLLKPLVHGIAMVDDFGIPNNTRTQPEISEGWRMLFNGKDLDGWTGYRKKSPPSGWSVQANQLMLTEPGCGALMATAEYENFELKLEWQLSDGQSSGVLFRVVETKPTPQQTGIEIELNAAGYSTLTAGQLTDLTKNGAVKHLYPPQRFPPKPGGWNELRLRVKDAEFQYWINGEEMGFVDKFDIVRPIEIGGAEWNRRVERNILRRFARFGKASRGYIALEDAGTPVRFRNIKLLKLEEK